MLLLGYERWENFNKAISRAMDSCETSGIEVVNHFREVTKMVEIGSGARRKVKDYMFLQLNINLCGNTYALHAVNIFNGNFVDWD